MSGWILRRSSWFGFCGSLVLGAMHLVGASAYVAESTASAIVIDGARESAWDAAPAESIAHELQGAIPSAADCSGEFRVLWNGTAGKLYFLVEVRDDTPVRDSGGNSWDDDNVEIYLDGDNSRRSGTAGASGYDGVNDYQIRFLPGGGGELIIAGAYYGGALDYAFASTSGGYILEGAIDTALAGIGAISSGVTQIGWDVQIGDDDDGGGRDHKLGWSSTIDDTWYNPASFGTLTFAGGGTSTPAALTVSTEGVGSVEVNPDKSSYVVGETIQLTARPGSGYVFAGWLGDHPSLANPLSLTLAGDTSVTARFVPGTPGATVFAMNCGGGDYTAEDGDVYQANNYSNPRSSGHSDSRWITADADYLLYRSWQVASTKLIYAIPLPNGSYEVDLKWAGLNGEVAASATLMDVSVAGVLVEDDLNVVAAAGATSTALVRTYPVIVTGGELRVVLFRSTRGEPFLNAIEVRSVSDPQDNAAPIVRVVDKPGVIGSAVDFSAGDFASRFFDADGDALAAIRIAATPVRGDLFLDGSLVRAGRVLAASDLDRLEYRSSLSSQGRDHWMWQGSDGTVWSGSAAAVHLFLRAGENRVENLITATWDTFQWPLFAYFPEGQEGAFNVVQDPGGVWRNGNACGPTARSHLNYFWKHPRQGTGNLSFRDNSGAVHELDFPSFDYHYDRMPATVTYGMSQSEYDDVAQLMADNDEIAVDIWFNGANTWEPMIPYQRFDGAAHLVERDEVGEAAWVAALKKELDMGRLLQISGRNAGGGGHWWLVSGYNEAGQFYSRLNFGPEGYFDNGDFAGYIHGLTIMTNMQPATLGLISLQAPVGGARQPKLQAGAANTLRWSAPNSDTVHLEYSVNGGVAWSTIAAGVDASLGAYAWTLPGTVAGDFRVRITDGADLNIYDESEPIQLLASVPAYAVTVSVAAGEGSVLLSPAGGTYPAGTVVTVSAVPDSGYAWSQWDGDVSLGQSFTVVVDEAKSFATRFTRSSTLRTGFDNWIVGFAGLSAEERRPTADPDADRLPNELEFLLAGGDPRVPNVAPCFAPGTDPETVVLSWTVPAGLDPADLRCELCPDPTTGLWLPAATVDGATIAISGQTVTLTVPAALAPRFVRFAVRW